MSYNEVSMSIQFQSIFEPCDPWERVTGCNAEELQFMSKAVLVGEMRLPNYFGALQIVRENVGPIYRTQLLTDSVSKQCSVIRSVRNYINICFRVSVIRKRVTAKVSNLTDQVQDENAIILLITAT